MVQLLLENNCDAPVLLRNFLESETSRDGARASSHVARAELPCSADPGSSNRCTSLAPKQSLLYDGMDKLEATAFQFSWDEEQQLGYQLPCANYTFCQGLETQAFGKSLNFDNQLGYSLPLGVSFLDAKGQPVAACAGGRPTDCAFDTCVCPEERMRVFDPYGPAPNSKAKGYSFEYCVSPDANRACVSSPTRDLADNPKDAQQCGRPSSLLCGVPGENCKQTDAWCEPRADIWAAVDLAAGKRASAVLDKVLLQAASDVPPTRPGREEMLAKFHSGAMGFQEAVNVACKQGATYNYDGSLTRATPTLGLAAGDVRLPADPNLRRPNSRGEGQGFAVTYECDGVNQFIPKDWLQQHGYPAESGDFGVFDWLQRHPPGPPARADMAANVGLKCDQHAVIKVSFCPSGSLPGPARQSEAQVEEFLKSQKLGVRDCAEFPGFGAEHNWGNCGRTNQGGAWACPSREAGGNWQCNVESPFTHVQEGGGCPEYCSFRQPSSEPR